MLVDLSRAVGTYLHDVFVVQLDWWIALGFLAQALFTMRFAVQWIASERAGRSVVPMAFWVFSIGGGLLLLVYALHRRDPVFIAGQGLGVFIYLRNLQFVLRERKMKIAANSLAYLRLGESRKSALKIGDQVVDVFQGRYEGARSVRRAPIWSPIRMVVQSNGMARLS